MSPLTGAPVLTAAELRAAEAAALAGGGDVTALMEAAGAGIARWTARLGSGAPVLVLCGTGNNGGDGYVAARLLRAAGLSVRVAAPAAPATAAAGAAAARWDGPIAALADAEPAPVLIDALLGTGASRPLDQATAERVAQLAGAARLTVAVDLPSGLDADRGIALGRVVRVDVTLALGAPKPAHVLQPAAALCGAVRVVPLPIATVSRTTVLAHPDLPEPGADSHKYRRGLVAVVAGAMPGAARLAAAAALRAGAGYALLLDGAGGGPEALVHRPLANGLDDDRIGALVIGPGFGRDTAARARLRQAIGRGHPLVLDGDALHLLDPDAVPADTILTPHTGEFDALFGQDDADKLTRTRGAAARSGAVVVHKGADTVIAAPDGRAVVAPAGSAWLSTAGSGDVLAGAIAACRAAGLAPFAAAQAGVWLHQRAAAALGRGFIADDLAAALSQVR